MPERKYLVQEARPNGLPPVERTYPGFDQVIGSGPRHLALVRTEDEVEVYALADPNDTAGLRAYLGEYWPLATILGTYTKGTR